MKNFLIGAVTIAVLLVVFYWTGIGFIHIAEYMNLPYLPISTLPHSAIAIGFFVMAVIACTVVLLNLVGEIATDLINILVGKNV